MKPGLPPLREVFLAELVLATNIMRYRSSPEGVRALLIDKDRKPAWRYASTREVPQDVLNSFSRRRGTDIPGGSVTTKTGYEVMAKVAFIGLGNIVGPWPNLVKAGHTVTVLICPSLLQESSCGRQGRMSRPPQRRRQYVISMLPGQTCCRYPGEGGLLLFARMPTPRYRTAARSTPSARRW